MNEKQQLLLGAHVSIRGGLEKAIERGQALGCRAIQIFTKNNKSYFGKILTEEARDIFKANLKESTINSVMAHTSYLINIGSYNSLIEKKSVDSLSHELERCEQLSIEYLVLHPGSYVGSDEKECIRKIAANLDKVFKKIPGTTMILLETAAGQGSNVGYTFNQLQEIYDLCHEKNRLGICLDTCHVFAAGYDIASWQGYKKMWDAFEEILGIQRLKAIHLNDSKMVCGSRKDRHENLGKGHIPLATFELIINDSRLKNIPKILETPSVDGFTEYKQEIDLLKRMICI